MLKTVIATLALAAVALPAAAAGAKETPAAYAAPAPYADHSLYRRFAPSDS